MGFVVDQVALGQVFLQLLPFYPISIIPQMLRVHIPFINHRCNNNLLFFYVSLTVHLTITLANDQLDAQTLIYLLQSSTCTFLEQYLAHP